MTTIQTQNQVSPKENFHLIKDFLSKFAQIEVSEGICSVINLELFDVEHAYQLSQLDAYTNDMIVSRSTYRFEFTADENGIWSESGELITDEYSLFFKQGDIRLISCTFTGSSPYNGW
ncbi:hypothetical protein [Kurthia sibirica]|uniref:Uncharacterized protein n=1 Tax=Kurthia sibirica TaxID=202750 RepID=A0A2U3AKH7_9BACL|nr:hypothetical protein [Kurthia sibirica]PWI25025.1 hypothetical protein DEX24_10655 [Kurthia sibirica]GEK33067.1 hypothetical protein KSI01_06000 [Kurthia sibirica]